MNATLCLSVSCSPSLAAQSAGALARGKCRGPALCLRSATPLASSPRYVTPDGVWWFRPDLTLWYDCRNESYYTYDSALSDYISVTPLAATQALTDGVSVAPEAVAAAKAETERQSDGAQAQAQAREAQAREAQAEAEALAKIGRASCRERV